MSDLVIFTRTVGEPYFEAFLERLCACTPEPHRLVVWVNGGGRESVAIAERYTDDLIITSKNKGCTATWGSVLLYEDYNELVQLSCALMVAPGWIERLRRPFREHRGVGVSGMRSEFGRYVDPPDVTVECGEENLPDHLLLTTRAVVNRVGAVSPSFQVYGHEGTEFLARTLRAGFRIFAVGTGCKRFEARHDGRDSLPERERYVRKNQGVWDRCARVGYQGYEWWRTDL